MHGSGAADRHRAHVRGVAACERPFAFDNSEQRTIGLATWIPVGLVIGTVVLWILAAIVGSSSNDQTTGSIAGLILIFSLLTLLAGAVGLLVVRPLVGPRAKVMEQQPGQYDRLVELRRVHPTFVAAVNRMHQAWAAQHASMQAPRNLPLPPGSI